MEGTLTIKKDQVKEWVKKYLVDRVFCPDIHIISITPHSYRAGELKVEYTDEIAKEKGEKLLPEGGEDGK